MAVGIGLYTWSCSAYVGMYGYEALIYLCSPMDTTITKVFLFYVTGNDPFYTYYPGIHHLKMDRSIFFISPINAQLRLKHISTYNPHA